MKTMNISTLYPCFLRASSAIDNDVMLCAKFSCSHLKCIESRAYFTTFFRGVKSARGTFQITRLARNTKAAF